MSDDFIPTGSEEKVSITPKVMHFDQNARLSKVSREVRSYNITIKRSKEYRHSHYFVFCTVRIFRPVLNV